MHKNTILIGSNLSSEQDGDIILGSSKNKLRFTEEGEIIYNGKEVVRSSEFYEKMSIVLDTLIGESVIL